MTGKLRAVVFTAFAAAFFSLSVICAADQPWDSSGFVADPKTVLELADASAPDKGDDITVLFDERRLSIDEQGRVNETRRMVYRINTPRGVETWDEISTRWQPWHQERPEVAARVITPDAEAHMLDVKTVTDAPVDEEDESTYNDDRKYRGPLPAVTVGAVVEEQVVLRDRAPFFEGGLARRIYFGRLVPVRQARLVLLLPSSVPLHYAVHLLPNAVVKKDETSGQTVLTVETGPMDSMEPEAPNLPTDEPRWPHVDFATGKSWKEVADSYRSQIEPQIRPDEVRNSLPLPKGAAREQVIRTEVEWLHKRVRYTGVEFGRSKLVPQPPSEILKRNYGDCKDKAALLVAMLRAQGIPAYVALLNADLGSQDPESEMPGMGLFDHAIVFVPGSPNLWIDATAEFTPIGALPAQDQGRLALVIREGTQALVWTPEASSTDNVSLETRELFLSELGPARVVETTEARGSLDSYLRRSFNTPIGEKERKGLEDYAKSTYAAQALAKVESGEGKDLSKPFRLRLEITDAKRGTTAENDAAVAIHPINLVSRLPESLREKPEDEGTASGTSEKEQKKKKRRTSDYLLSEAQITEWHYRIIPPPGFQLHGLPQNQKISLGPATLTEEFHAENDGIVSATLRFDTVKRRYSASEGSELRAAVQKLRLSPAIVITYDQVGYVLLQEGKIREALAADRMLIALHPKEGLHHAQLARVLLAAGLGEKARAEAMEATKLDPNSAPAYKSLGWVLEHDLIGRHLKSGFDWNGAVAADRKATELDSKDSDIRATLAILLEHDARGERYSRDARLDDAIAEYRTLRQNAKDNKNWDDNLGYALLYAGHYEELKPFVAELDPSNLRRALVLAATAASKGGATAIQASTEVGGNDADRRTALYNAGIMLMRMRLYPQAVELMTAGAKDQANSAQVLGLIQALSKTRRMEEIALDQHKPADAARRFFMTIFSEGDLRSVLPTLSRNALDDGKMEKEHIDDLDKARKSLRAITGKFGFPSAVLADLAVSNMRISAEGEDAVGFRLSVQALGVPNMTLFVVAENGAHKLLAADKYPGSIGREVRSRLAQGDLAAARKWLDWAREEINMGNGDDPLSGSAFARFWKRGQEADRQSMEYAGASLAIEDRSGKPAIEVLKQGRERAAADADRVKFDLALAHAYRNQKSWRELNEVALRLKQSFPDSDTALQFVVTSYSMMKDWTALEKLLTQKLEKSPDDLQAVRLSARSAEGRSQFDKARQIMRKLIDNGRAVEQDMNQYAWDALFTGRVTSEDIEIAQRGLSMGTHRNFATMHTLACLYADVGRTREARDLLLEAMQVGDLEEPNAAIWLGVGRIAEQYGEYEAARNAYKRVEKGEKQFFDWPNSNYALAQSRVKLVEAQIEKRATASTR